MKIVRSSVVLLLLAAASVGCGQRRPPENVSELADKFRLIDAYVAKSGYVVADRPVDASAFKTHEGYEYRVYSCTSALPSLLQIQVSLATNGSLRLAACTTPAREQPVQVLDDLSDFQSTVLEDLERYWMTTDRDYTRRNIAAPTSQRNDATIERDNSSIVWLSKQLEVVEKDLADSETALREARSRPQPDESVRQELQRTVRVLKRNVRVLKRTRDGITGRIAEFRRVNSEAEQATEPYSE